MTSRAPDLKKRFQQLLARHRRKPAAATWFALGNFLAEYPNLAPELSKEVGDAITCWRKCVRLDPKNKAAWLRLGDAHVEADDATNAVKAFNRVVKLDPRSALAWYRLGTLTFPAADDESSTRLKRAERYLQQAIKADPKAKKLGWEPYAWLAEIAERRRDDPGALAWYAESTRRGDRYAAARKQVIENHGARRRANKR